MRTIPTLKDGKQVHSNYTDEDKSVWKILFDRQRENLQRYASGEYLEGLETIGFNADEIPSFDKINKVLQATTGWEIIAVPGIVDDRLFFEYMSNRKFPATTWLRKMSELDYLEEPDMFHDVFAHVPLLTNVHFADFLYEMSRVSLDYINNPTAIELLSRIYWYTVEFGLIRENGQLKIYGAGILSSSGETTYSVSLDPMHFDFNAEHLLNSPYRKDVFQDRYFIIDSFENLYRSMHEIPEILKEKLDKTELFV
ncbi:phenylalanine 4-monooxygenase [Fulvivirga sedimenti]|uniref:phenylalanine 4-monooxygenase n=1 Tax=Fulvivirga sedimenti TaxID=2879465 RepID=A0A9X1HK65_9BACT|nr:phenylalanine 4-monooxygenase [Fulvivirga sedimenti]MCA6073575.1 phenylalanine 4-monooxygenase [Fulvivirga sedimenti]